MQSWKATTFVYAVPLGHFLLLSSKVPGLLLASNSVAAQIILFTAIQSLFLGCLHRPVWCYRLLYISHQYHSIPGVGWHGAAQRCFCNWWDGYRIAKDTVQLEPNHSSQRHSLAVSKGWKWSLYIGTGTRGPWGHVPLPPQNSWHHQAMQTCMCANLLT